MTSNNENWAFGESRGQLVKTIPVKAGNSRILAGSAVYLTGVEDGELPTVSNVRTGANNIDDVYGVACYNIEPNQVGIVQIYGITKLRNVCGTDIPFGSAVANDSGKLAPPHATTTSKAFAVNIGGALVASTNDTGIVFIDTIAGIIGGRHA